MIEIVKVTQPKLPKDAKAVIYPRANAARRTTQQRLDQPAIRALSGDVTGYFKASWVNGRWTLSRRIQGEDW